MGDADDDQAWRQGAAWATVIARWLVAQIAIRRLELLRRGALVLAALALALGIGLAALSLRFDPDWPWLVLGLLVALAGFVMPVVLQAGIWLVGRLALSRRTKPLATTLSASKNRVLAELDRAGVPVSLRTALRFLVALARGRQPQRGLAERLRVVIGRTEELIDVDAMRAVVEPPR